MTTRTPGAGERVIGPALKAAEIEFDAIRAVCKELERRRPGAGEGLAAQAAEVLRAVNVQMCSTFEKGPDPNPYARLRYARARVECADATPKVQNLTPAVPPSSTAGRGPKWTR